MIWGKTKDPRIEGRGSHEMTKFLVIVVRSIGAEGE